MTLFFVRCVNKAEIGWEKTY